MVNQHKSRHRSSTTTWSCSLSATLTYTPCTCRLSRTGQAVSSGILTIGPWLRIRIPDVGHKPTTLGSLSHNLRDLLFCKPHKQFFSFLIFLYIFTFFICFVLFFFTTIEDYDQFFPSFFQVRAYSAGTKFHWKINRINISHSSWEIDFQQKVSW